MAKVLCIEVGNSITRISEMDYKVKNPKVYNYLCLPTPKGVVEDGFIHENVEFSMAIRRALSDYKIKTKSVIFSVSSTKIVTREVTIPEIKMNQVAGYVKANANDYFPIDLSVYEIAHIMLGVEKGEDGPGKYRIMVMAAGKDLIAGYAQFASNCGLKLNCVDYSGNSIYQVMRSECGDHPTLVVKLEDNFTIASVIVNHGMVLQRSLAYGFERAVNTLMESPDFFAANYSDALKTMCERPCIKVVANDRTKIREIDDVVSETELAAEARGKITATFIQLLGNLTRVVELYNSKDPLNPVKEVIVVGLGSEIANITKLMTNELGIPARICNHMDTVGVFRPMDGMNYGRYINCYGAAIEPVGLVATETKGQKKAKSNVNYGQLATVVGVLALVVVGGMVGYSTFKVTSEKHREKELKELEQRYAEAERVHNRYLAIRDLQKEVEEKYYMTEHPNGNLYGLLEEMEKNLPSNIKMTDVLSDEEKAAMTFEAKDYEEVAKIFQIIRSFDSFLNVEMGSSVEEIETDDKGEETGSHIRFELIGYYFPMVYSETQTTIIDLDSASDASGAETSEAE